MSIIRFPSASTEVESDLHQSRSFGDFVLQKCLHLKSIFAEVRSGLDIHSPVLH